MSGKGGKKAKALKKAAHKEHRLLRRVTGLAETRVVKALSPAAKATDEPPLLALGLGTLALGTLLKRPTVIRSGARMVASHLVATGLKTVLKASVDRTRPNVAGSRPQLKKGSGTEDTDRNAFPSGHTAGAVAVAQAVAHEVPGMAVPARAVAGAAGALQVPRGAHYLTDVIAGAAVGWLAERIAGVAMKRVESARTAIIENRGEQEAAAHPS
jgi:membrane-associated phospholipid phosphatase